MAQINELTVGDIVICKRSPHSEWNGIQFRIKEINHLLPYPLTCDMYKAPHIWTDLPMTAEEVDFLKREVEVG